MFCHCVCVCLCVCSLYFERNILFCQHYDPQQDPPPPQKKTQHDMRNECFGGLSRSLGTRRALAGKILKCMPAGDSKNEPHQGKKPSFFFQFGHLITQKHISAASGAKIQSHNAIESWRLCSASACARSQGKTTKKHQSKWCFLFLLMSGHPSLSQGKLMVRVTRAPSQLLSARGMGQHNNQKGAIGTKERQQRNNNQNDVFFSS